MHTEEEAREKWCPFSRYGFNNGATTNRGDAYPPMIAATRCIASDCMAWRWATPKVEGLRHIGDPPPEPTDGYCGLAGIQ